MSTHCATSLHGKKSLNDFKDLPTHLVSSDYAGALKPSAWESELPSDIDAYDELIDGIKNGFRLVNMTGYKQVEEEDYRSATCVENKDAVEKQILTEIQEGRYVVVQAKPTIISALGAVLKKAGGVRIIHDASRPEGQSLNSFASIENKLTFETIANAEMMIQPGWYMESWI